MAAAREVIMTMEDMDLLDENTKDKKALKRMYMQVLQWDYWKLEVQQEEQDLFFEKEAVDTEQAEERSKRRKEVDAEEEERGKKDDDDPDGIHPSRQRPEKIQRLRTIPDSFANVDEYRDVFEPILLEECASQLANGSEEGEYDTCNAVITQTNNVCDSGMYTFLVSVPATAVQEYRDGDIVLLSAVFPSADDAPTQPHVLGLVIETVGEMSIAIKIFLNESDDIQRTHLGRQRKTDADIIRASRTRLVDTPKSVWQCCKLCSLKTTSREWAALGCVDGILYHETLIYGQDSLNDLYRGLLRGPGGPKYERIWQLTDEHLLKLKFTFDKSQLRAILTSFSYRPFVLVQGPPGTGKTRTLLGLIGAILHAKVYVGDDGMFGPKEDEDDMMYDLDYDIDYNSELYHLNMHYKCDICGRRRCDKGMLTCDGCHKYFHPTCVEIPGGPADVWLRKYWALVKEHGLYSPERKAHESVSWFCPKCLHKKINAPSRPLVDSDEDDDDSDEDEDEDEDEDDSDDDDDDDSDDSDAYWEKVEREREAGRAQWEEEQAHKARVEEEEEAQFMNTVQRPWLRREGRPFEEELIHPMSATQEQIDNAYEHGPGRVYVLDPKHVLRKRVLVCAPSNGAVDEITLRLLEDKIFDSEGRLYTPKVVRAGVNIHESVQSVSLEKLAEERMQRMPSYLYRERGVSTASLKDDARLLVIDEAHIVCTTLSFSGSDIFKRSSRKFDCVIIDEAAQAVEPSILIPLQLGAKQVFLVGDPLQLPATVLSSRAVERKYDTSLFERFMKNGYRVNVLQTQYRMHPTLREHPSERFYNGIIKDGKLTEVETVREWHEHLFFGPCALYDIRGTQEEQHGTSWRNVLQAECVVHLVSTLLDSYRNLIDPSSGLGVITPYKSQVRHIRELLEATLGEELANLIDVNSVDGFQGREKDIIIYSTVRTRKHGHIGFLQDNRRLNVAITRAKSSLIIVGDAYALRDHPNWCPLVDHLSSRDAVFRFDARRFKSELTKKVDGPKARKITNTPEGGHAMADI